MERASGNAAFVFQCLISDLQHLLQTFGTDCCRRPCGFDRCYVMPAAPKFESSSYNISSGACGLEPPTAADRRCSSEICMVSSRAVIRFAAQVVTIHPLVGRSWQLLERRG